MQRAPRTPESAAPIGAPLPATVDSNGLSARRETGVNGSRQNVRGSLRALRREGKALQWLHEVEQF